MNRPGADPRAYFETLRNGTHSSSAAGRCVSLLHFPLPKSDVQKKYPISNLTLCASASLIHPGAFFFSRRL
jgi:hypothetical protein